jgi:hypothetical protein
MAGHSKWSEIKRRKGLTESRDRARQAERQAMARGERPVYRVQVEPEGEILVIRISELDIATQARGAGDVAASARDCIATWLAVAADAFDIEIQD